MRSPLIALVLIGSLACSDNGPADGARSSEMTSLPTTQQRREWRQLAPVPTPRTEVAAAAADNHIYVIGGFANPDITVPLVEVYDIATDTWTQGPPLPVGVNHAMATSLKGEVYVLGGYLGPGLSNPTDRVFVLRDGMWEELPAMPEPRAAGGAAAVRGRIYVAGGVGPGGLADSTLVFDPDTETWNAEDGVLTAREHLGVARQSRRLYVVGGRTAGFASNLDAAERYNPARDRWVTLPDVPTARGGLAAAGTSNGLVVAAGGEGTGGTFDEVEAFVVETRRWRALPPMPTARHGLGVVVVGTTVYVLAGGPDPGLTYSDANEALDLEGFGPQ